MGETSTKRKPFQYRIQRVYFNSLILNFYYYKNCNEIKLSISLCSKKVRQIFVHVCSRIAIKADHAKLKINQSFQKHWNRCLCIECLNAIETKYDTFWSGYTIELLGSLAYMDENRSYFWNHPLASKSCSGNSALTLLWGIKIAL